MKYGYFDEDSREFVITRPDTPTPWINYLGSDEYCALISNTAGGYSFHKDPKNKRLTRYRYNNVPQDRPGRYIYVNDGKEFWSASWQPTQKGLSRYKYRARHGMGYTIIESIYRGIETKTVYFVPLGESLEIWRLSVKNTSGSTKKIKLFTYAEFCVAEAVMDMTDFQYTLNIASAVSESDIIFNQTGYAPEAARYGVTFFSSGEKTIGFDCDREVFIGPYRSESNPIAVERGRSFNSFASGGNPIASFSLEIKLKPKEDRVAVFVLGAADTKEGAKAAAKKFSGTREVDKKFEELKEHWNLYLSNFQTETPDKDVDLVVNAWNPYQCKTTFNWSRFASFYEAGIGRGMGFRDSNQDTLGVVHAIPERVKTRIKELAANQFGNGSTFHKFFPLTKTGEKGGYSDDPLWLIVSTSGYIKETGDIGFLEEEVPFADAGSGTMYEHLKRAIDFVYSERGGHKLPLIGFADWNDCLNLGTDNRIAESVWVAQLHYLALSEFLKLAKVCGVSEKDKDAESYKEMSQEIKALVNKTCWDGNWFLRAFDKYEEPVGSSKNKEGKIYLMPQAWAVMSGITDKDRAKVCMDMVKKHLDTKYGIMLMAPSYTKFDPVLGAITTFAPGLKENGGIFCHSNPWAMIAETILGRGDRAFSYYKKILPTTKNEMADIHMTEGYVYSQFITGNGNPNFGRARNSWLTGSAAWNFVAVTQYILGIMPDYGGLVIDPCIPRKWNGFKVRRNFRGVWYDIEVKNPKHVSKGVKFVEVDGKRIKGNLIDLGGRLGRPPRSVKSRLGRPPRSVKSRLGRPPRSVKVKVVMG